MAGPDDAILAGGGAGADAFARSAPRDGGAIPRAGLRSAIRSLDAFLQRIEGIREYSTDARCIFRIAPGHAATGLSCPQAGLNLRPGDRILDLHLWNEHVPRIAPSGPDFAWAKRLRRRTYRSLRELAARLSTDPALSPVKAVRARSVIATAEDRDKMARVFAGIGFRRVSDKRSSGLADGLLRRFNSLWASALVWTYNPHCPRRRILSRTCEEFWISRSAFLERFGA